MLTEIFKLTSDLGFALLFLISIEGKLKVDDYREFFRKGPLRDKLKRNFNDALNKSRELDEEELLNIPSLTLANDLLQKYKVKPIVLMLEEESQTNGGITVIRHDSLLGKRPSTSGRNESVNGAFICFHIPFEGDSILFDYSPEIYHVDEIPRGQLHENELCFYYKAEELDIEQVVAHKNRMLAACTLLLDVSAKDIARHEQELLECLLHDFEFRRAKILKLRQQVASLNIRPKRRVGEPTTSKLPEIRRKITPVATKRKAKFEPDPALDMAEYEHILSVISNMASVMEQSPSAFRQIKEPDLRFHFLVQLNGHYEGMATGETFNLEGKTDIVIKEISGGNIFIAECKYWKGEENYLKALDQLLGYVTFRDTRTAIIVFNRNRDFSVVLEKINEATQRHANFKRRDKTFARDSAFRYTFSNRNDTLREFLITVLAFDLPGKSQ